MTDPHVHLRDWNQAEKETVAHGLAVAAKAGFTHVFDMPNTNPPLTSRDAVLDRLALAGRTKKCKYHVYMGLTADQDQVKKAVDAYNELFPMVIGLKMFAGNSTGNMGITDESAQRGVFETLSGCGYKGVLAVHCEKEDLLRPGLYVPGCFETHSLARPAEAETQSVQDIICAAKSAGFAGTLHIAHVSCAGTVQLIREERKGCPFAISFGVTPHHALLTVEDAKDHTRYLKMNPPLREEGDRKAVFEALLDGTASWIESDHAPHTVDDKEKGASGIPGFAGMLHLVAALRKAGCPEERLAELCYGNCAKAFGLELEEKDMRIPAFSPALAASVAAEYPFDPYRRKTE